MIIYKVATSLTTVSGNISFNTLDIIGGLCHQMFIRANSSGTYFKANIQDSDSRTIKQYNFHKQEINDTLPFPLKGVNTINITNASYDDNFKVLIMVFDKYV